MFFFFNSLLQLLNFKFKLSLFNTELPQNEFDLIKLN